jgi:hypothetical protein
MLSFEDSQPHVLLLKEASWNAFSTLQAELCSPQSQSEHLEPSTTRVNRHRSPRRRLSAFEERGAGRTVSNFWAASCKLADTKISNTVRAY